jgi:phospholipid/cholesterol/gamma-HCH transport system ATP-binding protein
MLFQGSALFDYMTVEENVMFPLMMFGKGTRKEFAKRVDFCLERVNLPNTHKLFPSELSGGMQKRAAIARAIALNPKYLFCDEPNSGLDPKTGVLIDELIAEITKEYNITTVINTHDMNSVLMHGDSIHFIYKGEVEWRGEKSEFLNTKNEKLQEFIYATEVLKRIKPKS